MIVTDQDGQAMAATHTLVVGTPFLHGPMPLEMEGFEVVTAPEDFVRAQYGLEVFLVADLSSHWGLYRELERSLYEVKVEASAVPLLVPKALGKAEEAAPGR